MRQLRTGIAWGAAIALSGVFAGLCVSADAPVSGRTALFDGRDLSGWQPVGAGAKRDWSAEEGCIVCRGRGHTWLRTQQEYGDFNLKLEYQITPGANSGVYVRVPADGNHHRENAQAREAGFEVQILDDRAPRYASLKDYQYTASVYDIAGAKPRVSKPVGQWNTLEIDCAGQHVTVIHNGQVVVDAAPDRFPLLALRKVKGHLGLQSHNGLVRFRDLSIGPSRADKAANTAGTRHR